MWNKISGSYDKLIEKLWEWFESAFLVIPNFILAIVIVVASVFISRWMKKVALKTMTRFTHNEAVSRLVSNLITVVIIALGVFIALGILELEKTVTSLLAGAGVVGLAVGLAFQDPILNIISGISLTIKDVPFEIGDLVKTNGYYGIIQKITLRSTHLRTLSGEDVLIPNKMVLQNPIENYSFTKARRVDLTCGVAYNSDLELVKNVTIECIKNNITTIEGRDIEFMFTEFAGSSINFVVRFWTEEVAELAYLKNRSAVIIALKKTFDQNGISIPFPIRTLDIPAQTIEAIQKKS